MEKLLKSAKDSVQVVTPPKSVTNVKLNLIKRGSKAPVPHANVEIPSVLSASRQLGYQPRQSMTPEKNPSPYECLKITDLKIVASSK